MNTLIENFNKECERIRAGGDFSKTPMEFRVPELNVIAVKKNPGNLRYVPREYMTPDLVRVALEESAFALKYVPHDLQTQEMCDIAISANAAAVVHCAKKFVNLGMYLAALKHDGRLVREIPEELLSKKVCLLAAQNGAGMADVPGKYWTRDVLLAMCARGNILMWNLEEKLLIQKGDDQNNYMKDEELWIAAAKGNAKNLKEMPRKFLTYENCLKIAKEGTYRENPFLYLPPRLRTQEMLAAVIDNMCARDKWETGLDLVSENAKNYNPGEDFRLILMGLDSKSLSFLTPDLIGKCMSVCTGNLRFVPKKYLTEELICRAFEQSCTGTKTGDLPHSRPGRWGSTEYCLVNVPEYCLEDVPASMRTTRICLKALACMKVFDILSVPDAAKTKDMVLNILRGKQAFPASGPEEKFLRADGIARFVPASLVDREIYETVAGSIEENVSPGPRRDALLRKWRRKAEKAGLAF